MHARDIIERLLKAHCESRNAFEWQQQLRFYWVSSEYSRTHPTIHDNNMTFLSCFYKCLCVCVCVSDRKMMIVPFGRPIPSSTTAMSTWVTLVAWSSHPSLIGTLPS